MLNPYISKQTLLEKRSEIETKLRDDFSYRVQKAITEAIRGLYKNLKDSVDIRVDLSQEKLSYSIYSSILEKHCELLRELDYSAHVSKINLYEDYALIHLDVSEE